MLLRELRETNDPALREKLIEAHLGLVEYLARRFAGRGEPLDDLIQVATIGLVKAVDRFDPDREVEFSTYATPTIVGELKRHFRDKRWQVRVHRTSQENMLAVRDVRAALTQQLRRSPADHEVAEEAGISIEELREAEHAEMAFRPYYLDAPVSAEEEATTFGELLGGDDPGIEHTINSDALWRHWSTLPQRQQRILAMRFYGNMTQAEIGHRLGISQMHVSRLLDAALTQLRDRLSGGTAPPRKPRPRRRIAGAEPLGEPATGESSCAS